MQQVLKKGILPFFFGRMLNQEDVDEKVLLAAYNLIFVFESLRLTLLECPKQVTDTLVEIFEDLLGV